MGVCLHIELNILKILYIAILRMQKSMPDEFNFMPKTWILPADYSLLQNHAKELKMKKKSKTFIAKPSNGAQGHG